MTATHKSIDYFLVTDCRKKRNIFQENPFFFEGRKEGAVELNRAKISHRLQ